MMFWSFGTQWTVWVLDLTISSLIVKGYGGTFVNTCGWKSGDALALFGEGTCNAI